MVALGLKRQAGNALEDSMFRAIEQYPESSIFQPGVDFVQINVSADFLKKKFKRKKLIINNKKLKFYNSN